MLCVTAGFLVLTKCLSLEDAEKSLEPGDRVKQRGPSCEEAGGGSRLSGNQGRNEGRVGTSEARASPGEESRAHRKSQCPKVWGQGESGRGSRGGLCSREGRRRTPVCSVLDVWNWFLQSIGAGTLRCRRGPCLSHSHRRRKCPPSEPKHGCRLPCGITGGHRLPSMWIFVLCSLF